MATQVGKMSLRARDNPKVRGLVGCYIKAFCRGLQGLRVMATALSLQRALKRIEGMSYDDLSL